MWLAVLFSVVLLNGKPVLAEESGITVTGEIKSATYRLLDEGSDFVTTPFTIKDGNLFWTAGIVGAAAVAYINDGSIRDRLQGNVRGHGLDKATDIGAQVGNPFLHLGVAAVFYGGGILADSPRWKETGEMMGEAAILADGATLVLKEATGRGRPVATSKKNDFKPLAFETDYDSFPSMHTSSSFAMASVIARTSESIPVALMSYSAATFVGFSRLYQNKHWASDVVIGAAIGELAGRVATACHAEKGRRIAVIPGFSNDTVTMNMLYRFQ
jgi:membrane-associated phospholipid phosphatase